MEECEKCGNRFKPKDYIKGKGTYCDNCFSSDINYGKTYRICKKCNSSIDTTKVIWG